MARRQARRSAKQQAKRSMATPVPQPSALHVARRPHVPLLLSLALGPLLIASGWAAADTTLPGAGQITHGSGSIQRGGARVDVHQQSRQMIANWESFNVGRDATVRFHQPDASAIVLNRVLSQDASRIAGRIAANGQIMLVNPAGILFTESARIDVGSLVAAGQNISDRDFLDGNFRFTDLGSGGSIVNHGRIRTGRGGYVALVGATINNTGEIVAPGGTAALAAGDTVRLEISDNSLIGIRMDGATATAAIDNSGVIAADDGRVILHSAQSRGALRAAVRQTGEIRANRLTLAGDGSIRLEGGDGDVELGGTMLARGEGDGLTGGEIVATGERLRLTGTIDASGDAGGGEVFIGGGWQGNDPSIPEPSEIVMERGAEILADALRDGDGGTVALWSSDRTRYAGHISARGAGSGSGGEVETSSRGVLGVTGTVDVTGPNGRGGLWLLDPEDMEVTSTTESADDDERDVVSSESVSEALSGDGVTVVLQASNTIRVESGVTSGSSSTLMFDAGGGIYIDAATQAEIDAGRLTMEEVRQAAEQVIGQAGSATITLDQVREQLAGGTGSSTSSGNGSTTSTASADRVLPTGGRITGGDGSLAYGDGRLDINQRSDRLIATWATFNVGEDARVNFNQPGPRAVALNRIFSNSASEIRGRITANGQVILVNPAGVVFTETARIDVGALSAVGSYRADDAFMAAGDDNGHDVGEARSLINHGEIRSRDGGSVTLVGNRIENTGMIDAAEGSILLTTEAMRTTTATNGRVNGELLADSPTGVMPTDPEPTSTTPTTAATTPTTDSVDADDSVPMTPAETRERPSIVNTGTLQADDGWITLFTSGRSDGGGGEETDTAINQQGVIRANRLSVERNGGEIRIDAGDGDVMLAGQTTAQGNADGVSGGRITATGQTMRISGLVDASGDAGGGDIFLGGGWQGNDPDIREAQTLIVERDAVIRADATSNGDGGTIALWSSDRTRFDGSISARGAGDTGRGGAVETSSRGRLGLAGLVNVSADSGMGGLWLLDPENLHIVADDDPNDPQDLDGNENPADQEFVKASSISTALDAGGDVTVTLQADKTITVKSDISKIAGTDATLVFDAGNAITIDADATISASSNADALNIIFGKKLTDGGKGVDGLVTIKGELSSNGGKVEFLTAVELANPSPITTQVTDGSVRDGGDILFHQNVYLNPTGRTVELVADGEVIDGDFRSQGGDITFKQSIFSGDADPSTDDRPIILALSNAGKELLNSGVISVGSAVGHELGGAGNTAIRGLEWTSDAPLVLNADSVNILASTGTALTANSSLLDRPVLELHAETTTINVVGGNVGGTSATIDYVQDSFDVVAVKDADQTFRIDSDRSIRVDGFDIKRKESSNQKLNIELNPYVARNETTDVDERGGSVILNNAGLYSKGGNIHLGGISNKIDSDFAVGVGEGGAGVRIVDSVIDTTGNGDGDLTIRGKAPRTNVSGAGVLIQGSETEIRTGTGDIDIQGVVMNGAGSGNKDGLIIGEGGSGRVSIGTTSGNIVLLGDASAVGDVPGGARYNGLMITDRTLISTVSGDLLLIGLGGGGNTPNQNHGIKLSGEDTSLLSQSGEIRLFGTSGGLVSDTADLNSYGIFATADRMFIGRGSDLGETTGDILLQADSMQFINTSANRLRVSSSGSLLIQPENEATNIVFGNAGSRPETDGIRTLFLGENWFNGGVNSVFLTGPQVTASILNDDGNGLSNTYRLGVLGNAGGDFSLILRADGDTFQTTAPINFNVSLTSGLSGLAGQIQEKLRDVAGFEGTTVQVQSGQFDITFMDDSNNPVFVRDGDIFADAADPTDRQRFRDITVRNDLTGAVTVASTTTFRDDLTILTGDRSEPGQTLASVVLNADLIVQRQPNNTLPGGSVNHSGTGGTLTIDVADSAGGGGLTARGAVRADQLLLLGFDEFVLSGNNQINRLAADIDGDLTLRNQKALEVGTVVSRNARLDEGGAFAFDTPERSGITLTEEGQLDLVVEQGDLVQKESIRVQNVSDSERSGVVSLRALEGSILQDIASDGPVVQAESLFLEAGSGTSQLLNNNSVSVLGGLFTNEQNANAGLSFANAPLRNGSGAITLDSTLTIGEITVENRVASAAAGVVNGEVLRNAVVRNGLEAQGESSRISLSTLDTDGHILQQAMSGDGSNSRITAGELLLIVQDGHAVLENTSNNIGLFAASIAEDGRNLSLRNAEALTIPVVLLRDNGHVQIAIGGGTLTLTGPIRTLGDGGIDLRSGGSIVINPEIGQNATISSDSGTIQLLADSGSITTTVATAEPSTHTELSTSGSVLMRASDAIGSKTNRIEMENVSTVAADGGAGGIWLRKLGSNVTDDAIIVSSVSALNENSSLGRSTTVEGVPDSGTRTLDFSKADSDFAATASALSGLTTLADGNITLTTKGGNLLVKDAIEAGGDGYIDLRTAQAGSVEIFNKDENGVLRTATGSVQIVAGGAITTDSENEERPDIDVGDTGSILLEANSIGANDSRIEIAGTGTRTLAARARDGDIWLRQLGAESNITVGTVDVTNDMELDNAIGGIGENEPTLTGLTTLDGNGAITLTTQGGSITIVNNIATHGTGTIDLRTAADEDGAGNIAINGATLSAGAGSGTVQLIAAGNISTSTMTGTTVEIETEGDVLLTAAGAIGAGEQHIELDKAATLTAEAADGIFLTQRSGTVSIGMVNAVRPDVGVDPVLDASATNQSGLVTTTANSPIIFRLLANDLSVDQPVTAAGSGNILLEAVSGGISLDSTVTTNGGTVHVAALGAITTNSPTNATPEIDVGNDGKILLAAASIARPGNRIELAGGNTFTLAALASDDDIWLRALGDDDEVSLVVGKVSSVSPDSGVADGDEIAGVTTESNGNIALTTEGRSIHVQQAIDADGSGDIDLRTAGSGNVAIFNDHADNDGRLQTATGTVQVITSGTGTITTDSENAATVDIDVGTGGSILLQAASIGDNEQRIEIAGAGTRTLAANAEDGSLWLRQLGTASNIVIEHVEAVNRGVDFDARADDLAGLTTGNSGNITLSTQGGDIVVKKPIDADGSGYIDLRTAGSGAVVINNADDSGVLRTATGTVQVIAGGMFTTDSNNGVVADIVVDHGGSILLEATNIGDNANRIQIAGAGTRTLAARARDGLIWLRQLGTTSNITVGTVDRTNVTELDNAIGGVGPGEGTNLANLAGLTTQAGNGAVTLTTQGGSITVVNNIATHGTGTIDLRTAADDGAGNIAINGATLSAGGGTGNGTIQLIAAGNISTITPTGTTVEIETAGGVLLTAAGAIGAGGQHIELDKAATLTAKAAGGIFLTQRSGTVAIDTIAAVSPDVDSTPVLDASAVEQSGLATTGDDAPIIFRLLVDDLIVNQGVDAAGTSSNLLLQADSGGVTVNNQVTSGTGNLSVIGFNDVLLNDGAALSIGSGDLTGGDRTILVESKQGSIVMAGHASASTTGGDIGNIRFMAQQDVRLSQLITDTGNVAIVAGGDILDAYEATIGVDDVDDNGFAVEPVDRGDNIIASAFRLEAGGNIGIAGNPLDTRVATLALDAGGDAYIYESTALTLGEVKSVMVSRVGPTAETEGVTDDNSLVGVRASTGSANDGVAKIETINGSLTVNEQLIAGGDVLLAAGGAIGAHSDLLINAGVEIGSGALTLLARRNINQEAGTILINGAPGDAAEVNSLFMRAVEGSIFQTDSAVATTPGNVWLRAANNVTLGSVGGAALRIEAGESITTAGTTNPDVTGEGRLQLVADGDVGGVDNPLVLKVDLLAARGVGMTLNNVESPGLEIGVVDAFDVARVALNSTAPLQTTPALAGLEATTDLTVDSSGNLTVSADVVVDTDNLRLAADAGGTLTIDAAVSVGDEQHLSLLGDAGVVQTAAARVTSGGTLDIESDSGSIRMAAGAVNTALGDIRLAAARDVVIGRIETPANVAVLANGGSILDAGGTAVDIRADQLQLLAQNSVGTASNPIETQVNRLAGRAGSGGFHVNDTGALVVGSTAGVTVQRVNTDRTLSLLSEVDRTNLLTSGNGPIRLGAGGTLTLASTLDSGSGLTALQASGIQGGGGVVNAGQARLQSNGPVVMTGSNRIGVLAASVAGGSLSLNNVGTLTVGAVDGAAGVSTAGAGISLTTSGGNLQLAQQVSTGGTASGTVSLRAAGGSLIRLGSAGLVRANALNAVASGDVLLTAPNNPVSTPGGVLMNSGANDVLTVAGSAGGNFVFAGSNRLNVGSVAGSNGVSGQFVWLRSAGDLTLDRAVSGSGSGLLGNRGIVLASGGLFRNNTGLGAGALRDNGAGWLIYDEGSLRDLGRLGGLVPDFTVFNVSYDNLTAGRPALRGRGFITGQPFLRLGTGVTGLEEGALVGGETTLQAERADQRIAPLPWAFGEQSVPEPPRQLRVPSESVTGAASGLEALGSAPVVSVAADAERGGLFAEVSLRVEPGLRFRADIGRLVGVDGQVTDATLDDGSPLPDWLTLTDTETGPVFSGTVPSGFIGSLDLRVQIEDPDTGEQRWIALQVVAGQQLALSGMPAAQ